MIQNQQPHLLYGSKSEAKERCHVLAVAKQGGQCFVIHPTLTIPKGLSPTARCVEFLFSCRLLPMFHSFHEG